MQCSKHGRSSITKIEVSIIILAAEAFVQTLLKSLRGTSAMLHLGEKKTLSHL